MKKFMAVITAALCIALFVGCGSGTKITTENPKNTKNEQKTEDGTSALRFSPTFESLSTYNEYVDEQTSAGNVPEYFLGYEKLRFLGDFESVVLLPGFDQYLCTFNSRGTEFDMYVYHELSDYMKENPMDLSSNVFPEEIQPQNTKDMRAFGEGESVSNRHCYVFQNIRYTFFGGKLESISWYANGTYCSLSAENYSSYPLISNTFQSKLLNLDTAVQAITEHFGTPQPIEDFFNQG